MATQNVRSASGERNRMRNLLIVTVACLIAAPAIAQEQPSDCWSCGQHAAAEPQTTKCLSEQGAEVDCATRNEPQEPQEQELPQTPTHWWRLTMSSRGVGEICEDAWNGFPISPAEDYERYNGRNKNPVIEDKMGGTIVVLTVDVPEYKSGKGMFVYFKEESVCRAFAKMSKDEEDKKLEKYR